MKGHAVEHRLNQGLQPRVLATEVIEETRSTDWLETKDRRGEQPQMAAYKQGRCLSGRQATAALIIVVKAFIHN